MKISGVEQDGRRECRMRKGEKQMTLFWMRAENRDFERRAPLTAESAAALIAAGHQIMVEASAARALPIEPYLAAGCERAEAGSWVSAPREAVILGLKELPEDGTALPHRHIMFGHAYKGQADGGALLARFASGGGQLLDLEYLTDEAGRRACAFGYWAGFAGAAVGVMAYAAAQGGGLIGPVEAYPDKNALVDDLRRLLKGAQPSVIVIGALGRVGRGAVDLAAALDLEVTGWDRAETAHGGPFPELLAHEIFVNAIFARPGVPVFVGPEAIAADRALRVIADVSCDPSSDYNPVPLYDAATSFAAPVTRVSAPEEMPLDVMAIDNLPSMLPKESSEDFAAQLLPLLLDFDRDEKGMWARALALYNTHAKQ